MRIPDNSVTKVCLSCLIEVRHSEVWVKNSNKTKGNGSEYSWKTYHSIECVNCHAISFVERDWCNEGQMSGDSFVKREIFHPATPFRSQQKWMLSLEPVVVELLNEIYSAASHKLYNLSVMGTRTIIDLVLTELVGDIGGFERKLKTSIEENKIESKYKEPILALIDSGHATSHRGHLHSEESFSVILDLLEQILFKIYIAKIEDQKIELLGKQLRETTPSRTK